MKNFICFLAIIFSLISCTTQKETLAKPAYNIKEIVKSDDVTFVDVRIPEQFQEATVSGAINIPLAELENNIDELRKKGKVVVFCNRGMQADSAMKILQEKGLDNVYDGTTWKNVKAILEEK